MPRLLAFIVLLVVGAGGVRVAQAAAAVRRRRDLSRVPARASTTPRASVAACGRCRPNSPSRAAQAVETLRGRVLAGIAAPGRLRLEAVAPFGPPVFILAASGTSATLLLPRDNRVLTGEPASAILRRARRRGARAGRPARDPDRVCGAFVRGVRGPALHGRMGADRSRGRSRRVPGAGWAAVEDSSRRHGRGLAIEYEIGRRRGRRLASGSRSRRAAGRRPRTSASACRRWTGTRSSAPRCSP